MVQRNRRLNIMELVDAILATPVNLTDPKDQAHFLIYDSALPGRMLEQLCDNKVSYGTINKMRADFEKYPFSRCQPSTIEAIAVGYQRLLQIMNDISNHLTIKP